MVTSSSSTSPSSSPGGTGVVAKLTLRVEQVDDRPELGVKRPLMVKKSMFKVSFPSGLGQGDTKLVSSQKSDSCTEMSILLPWLVVIPGTQRERILNSDFVRTFAFIAQIVFYTFGRESRHPWKFFQWKFFKAHFVFWFVFATVHSTRRAVSRDTFVVSALGGHTYLRRSSRTSHYECLLTCFLWR